VSISARDDVLSRSRRRAATLLITLTVFFDEVSYGVIVPVLPRQAEKFGWSEIEIALLVGILGLSGLATAPFVGRLSKRLGPRRLFFAGLALLATGTGLCAFDEAYAWILTGRTLQGVSVAVTAAVGMAYLAKIYPAGQRGGAMGVMAGGFAAGSIAGPAVGGALFDRVGYSIPFVLIFLCVVILALASAKVLPNGRASRGGRDSFRALLVRPRVRLLVLYAALGMGVFGMLEAVVPLHLERSFGTGPTVIGLVFVGAALGQGLASPLAGVVADFGGTRFTILAGLTLLAITMIAVSVGGSVSAVAVSLCAAGVASAFALVPILPRMAELGGASDETSYSSAYALLNLALDTGMMVGPLLGGALVSVLGFAIGILVVSAILFAGAWLAFTEPG
jgi:MFS transporter, DHA1 family, solute carrier family 18 (vesicular amine transporter), member 1/2